MSPSIDKAFNLWSKAVPLLKIKWQCCIREQHLVAGKDRSVGRSHLLPTTSRHGGGWIRGQLSPSSLHTQTVVNQQIAIHVADKFTGKKTQSARRRMRMNGLEWEGLGLCSCSGHGVCAPVWGHGVPWASSPPHSTPQFLHNPWERHTALWDSPPPAQLHPRGLIHPPRHCCKHNWTDFGSAPTPGWTNPRVLPKDLELAVLGPRAAAQLGPWSCWTLGQHYPGAGWALELPGGTRGDQDSSVPLQDPAAPEHPSSGPLSQIERCCALPGWQKSSIFRAVEAALDV